MINGADDVTAAVVAAMEHTEDARLREILVSLVQHLHGFANEVGLTEAELRSAAAIVNDIGRSSTATHNEAVLLAGHSGCRRWCA